MVDKKKPAGKAESRGSRAPKQMVTIRLGADILEYFKQLAEETGVPYQSLINLYLRDCALHHRKLHLKWAS